MAIDHILQGMSWELYGSWMIWIDYGKQTEQAPFVIAAAVAVMIAAAAFLSGRHRLEGRWQQHLDGKAGYQPCGFTTW